MLIEVGRSSVLAVLRQEGWILFRVPLVALKFFTVMLQLDKPSNDPDSSRITPVLLFLLIGSKSVSEAATRTPSASTALASNLSPLRILFRCPVDSGRDDAEEVHKAQASSNH